ncbi:hypothetical protein [Bdellovibrio sp. HCB-110]|uniref:hypothetical protein n=1 Tax=Bdellovibrio sp. HCB-110 TaxID=3391182 RepID=UPI0039B6B09C
MQTKIFSPFIPIYTARNFKKIISAILVFQLVLSPLAYADNNDGRDGNHDGRIDLDFDDDFVISPGRDNGEGSVDGNCAGSGCDDRDGNGVVMEMVMGIMMTTVKMMDWTRMVVHMADQLVEAELIEIIRMIDRIVIHGQSKSEAT